MSLLQYIQKVANLIPDLSPLPPGLSAQVNATILSIFAAGLTAFLLHARQTVVDWHSKAVAIASRINHHETKSGYHEDPGLPIPHGPDDRSNVQELLNRFREIAARAGRWGDEQPSDRGHALLRTWSRITRSYPFPPRIESVDEDDSVEHFDGKIQLSGPSELRSWVETAESVSNEILSVVRTHQSKIERDLEAVEGDQPEFVSESQREALEEALPEEEFEDMEPFMALARPEQSIPLLYRIFLEQTQRLSEIVTEVQDQLHAAEQLGSALPAKRTLVVSSTSLAVAFSTGVALPLLFSTTPALVYVGIPLLLYFAGIGAIILLANRGPHAIYL